MPPAENTWWEAKDSGAEQQQPELQQEGRPYEGCNRGASSVRASEVTCPGTNLSAPLPVTCPRVPPSTEDGRKRHPVPPT